MRLAIDRVSKQYKNKIAVDRISLKLEKGVYGLLGENGAGKTTLMRMICGVVRPDSGTISLDEMDAGQEAYRAVLGYLPQEFGYYPEFEGEEFLLYMGALKGMPKAEARRRAKELLELLGLKDVSRRKIKTFSGGMRQRLGIADVLMKDPDIIIMDEPTLGIDPEGVRELMWLIRDLAERDGRTILLSSHQLCRRQSVLSILQKENKGTASHPEILGYGSLRHPGGAGAADRTGRHRRPGAVRVPGQYKLTEDSEGDEGRPGHREEQRHVCHPFLLRPAQGAV